MAETSSSFIPKRTNTQNRRAPRRNNFFILAIISYALFIAAPIASAVVFIYEIYTEKQYAQSVIDLDSAIKTFSVADMERVTEFESRLRVADTLLDTHVSVVSLLNILESKTAATVQFDNLEITRTDANTLTVSGDMAADEFNAVLFQREVFKNDRDINQVAFTDLTFAGATSESTSQSVQNTEASTAENTKLIGYKADLVFSADTILYEPEVIEVAPSYNMDAGFGSDIIDSAESSNEFDI